MEKSFNYGVKNVAKNIKCGLYLNKMSMMCLINAETQICKSFYQQLLYHLSYILDI